MRARPVRRRPRSSTGCFSCLGWRTAVAAPARTVSATEVVERRPDGQVRRYVDLPEALHATADEHGPREWRIHFHVPLFREELGVFQSTQPYLRELIGLLKGGSAGQHWEVETYTWDVLPEEFRAGGVVTAVAREMQWVIDQMREARTA